MDKTKKTIKKEMTTQKKLYVSILLALIALVSISAASVAWFTIADFTKVHSMNLQITSGINLRFDLDPHEDFNDYIKVLSFANIADRIKHDLGYDMRKTPLEPVTTSDCTKFTFQDGKIVETESGAYLEFVLHFMATEDMIVHLTTANNEGMNDGTKITSSNANLPGSMRISFTVDGKNYVYVPDLGDVRRANGKMTEFGLLPADKMILNDNNALFRAEKDVNKPVTVRVWLEGTDPSCTDDLRDADYSIRLRFVGTDEDNNVISSEK